MFAAGLEKLPPKPGLDAYTTTRILGVRAEWAMDPAHVLASRGGPTGRSAWTATCR